MNTRKTITIALAVLLAVALVVVGITVWPPPKEARADPVIYQVYVWWDDPNDNPDMGPLPVTDALIEFMFDGDGDGWEDEVWQQPTGQGGGYYKFTRNEGYAVHWQVVLGNMNWVPVNPNERFYQPPDTWNSFDWEVEE